MRSNKTAKDEKLIDLFLDMLAAEQGAGNNTLDAYRRELLLEAELGLGNAVHVNAYKIAGLVPGSLSLILADRLPGLQVFVITALFMLPGMLLAILAREPDVAGNAPKRRAVAFLVSTALKMARFSP